ncbi:MAG: penicillin-binding protein 2, partial [Candidatus Limisoma sp.]|nr:penicillin-binding protein 2 [Candidatus Limisoma sp.]
MKKDYSLEKRKYVIAGLLILLVVIYLIRLFELQVFDSKYKENADSNAFLRKTIYPSRGQIFDRKGRLVVYNQPAYDVMVIPREIKPDFDSIDFCNTLQI